jgi:hypothetical protein
VPASDWPPLILSHLAAPAPLGPLLTDRFVETMLGVVVAIAVLLTGQAAIVVT